VIRRSIGSDPADDERLVTCFQLVRHSGISLYIARQETDVIEPAPVREFVSGCAAGLQSRSATDIEPPARAPPVIPA